MSKEFIPYELAVKLKELGFDEPCFYQYVRDFDDDGELIPITSETKYPIIRNNTQVSHYSGGDCFAAPTFSQAFRWFRDNGIDYSIIPMRIDGWNQYQYIIFTIDEVVETGFDTYEEAELACLTKLIEIVQGGNNE